MQDLYATVRSCALAGVEALPIIVEVHITTGLPAMQIVGLPQTAVRESKDRVQAAIRHAGLIVPEAKITVNLAPADVPKQGGRFDLPIAIAVLVASGQLPESSVEKLVVLGELGLTGELRTVRGVLPSALSLADSQQAMLLPWVNRHEALRAGTTSVYAMNNLRETCDALRQPKRMQPCNETDCAGSAARLFDATDPVLDGVPDMADIKGLSMARRALELSAAGGHNVLLVGPPGTGKSMLASRLPGILPSMTTREASEAASVASISHAGFDESRWGQRPFRAPHHTASGVALIGGGSQPMPGEASLAHAGVLFLDELPEFSRHVLDVLREPLETGHITVSRAARQADFPARFQLIAAMNPCPCGYYGDTQHLCRCTQEKIRRYQTRISGPFLDRIDLHLQVTRIEPEVLQSDMQGESSAVIRERVKQCRERQLQRQACTNSSLAGRALEQFAKPDQQGIAMLNHAAREHALSLRAIHRVQRLARTIADLAERDSVVCKDIGEALAFRDTGRRLA